MAAAVLFGAIHALMPGHGKTVLVSYHLGQPTKLREGVANGAILGLTHVGLALVLVLAGFAVISKAFAYGGRTPQFETASGVVPARRRLVATALTAAAQVEGACLIKERLLAGEVVLTWDVRRSHPVPPALTDFDKFPRYTAFRPYPVYRHPEQSLQEAIARLRP